MFLEGPSVGRSTEGAAMFRNRIILVTLLAVVMAFAAAALATPGSGVTGVIQARAKFLVPVDIKVKIDDGHQDVIHVPDSKDTVIQQVVFEPHGFTGWHSHPGPAIALVKSGTVTLFDSDDPLCKGKNYTAGQAFVDYGQGHGHLAGNPSATERAELWITYFDVPPGAAPRVDQQGPSTCPF
jgi:hypothetical protein